jgi:phosphomethylpyrimidine synthase
MTAIQDQPTTEGTAFPGSRKTYLQGSREDLKVPMREVVLSTGDSVVLYDTSGPYTDTALRTDIPSGCPRCGNPGSRSAPTLPPMTGGK